MGNILNPSPGDLIDRQTIVQLKLEHAAKESDVVYAPTTEELLEQSPQKSVARTRYMEKDQIDIQPWILENNGIQDRLHRDWIVKLPATLEIEEKYNRLHAKLKGVNGEMWDLENQAHTLRHAPDRTSELVIRRKADCLDAITKTNEFRYELIDEINEMWGIVVKEKIYA